MKQNILLIVSVIVGIIAAILTRQYLVAKDNEVKAFKRKLEGDAVKVVVVAAARPIPMGTVIKAKDLGTREEFESAVRGHAVFPEDVSRIIGRKTIQTIDRLDTVFWSDIEGGESRFFGLADDIQDGMRALSINVSGASAVSGMIRPNDHVDVLGTFTFPSSDVPGEQELVTLTVLQDVTVMATGQETAKNVVGRRGQPTGGYSLVTLAVTPREAEMLVFAQQVKGRLTLTLRNSSDIGFEQDLPRVDFDQIEAQLQALNIRRQVDIRRKVIQE